MNKVYSIKDWQRLCEPENWHPAANMFTLMNEEDGELAALAENIKMTGLLNPVVMLEGKVLDGRNRLLACRLAGVEPRFVDWDGSGQSPAEWVVAQNVNRRNLTSSQKAYAALYLIKTLKPTEEQKKQFKKWDKRIWLANMLGIGRHYISDIEQIDKWTRMDPSCNQWDKLPSQPHPELLEQIKTGVHACASMCREIDFKVAQLKDPELTEVENKECSTGDLSKNFFSLIPRHSMRLAFEDASKSIRKEDKPRLARYWERLQKEYPLYEEQ
jgi:hypothetical protein